MTERGGRSTGFTFELPLRSRGEEEANRRIASVAATREAKLDLSDLRLTKLPESICTLDWLEELSVGGFVKDISVVNSLGKLAKLRVHDGLVTDLTPLEGLTHLRHVDVTDCQVSDIQPLSTLTHLEDLRLTRNPISDLSPLSGFVSLRRLDLIQTNVSDVAALESATNLDFLDLDRTKVRDVGPLANLANLTALWLNHSMIDDLETVSTLRSLQRLGLNGTRISNFSRLSEILSLTVLWLDETSISDLGPLAKLTKLNRLSLRGTPIADLGPLRGLTALRDLDLRFTRVADISPLAGLVQLKCLRLESTQAQDLTPLQNVTALSDAVVGADQGSAGLHYNDTPVLTRKPFGQLGRLNEPARTVETINYLRRSLNNEPYYPTGYEPFLANPVTQPEEIQVDAQMSAALEQRPASYSFGFEKGRFEARPQIGQVPQPGLAEEIRKDLKAKAEQALVRFGNAPVRVQETVKRLAAALGSAINDVTPGVLLMRARSLEADISAYDTKEARAELLPDAMATLKDLGASVDDLKACFPQIAEIEASRIAQGLLDTGVEVALQNMRAIRAAAQKSIAVGDTAISALTSGDAEIAHAGEVLESGASSDVARAGAIRRRANVVGQQLLDYRNFVAGVLRFAGTELSQIGADTWKEARKEVPTAMGKAAGEIAASGLKVTIATMVTALVHPLAGLALLLGSFRPLSEKAKAIDSSDSKKVDPQTPGLTTEA